MSKTKELLKERIKNWEVLIESLPYPVSVHDADFNIVLANKAVFDLCGVKHDIGKMKCYHLYHGSDSPVEGCPMIKTLESGKTEHTELYDSKLKKHLKVCSCPVKADNNIIGVVHSVIDLSREKKSSEVLKNSIRNIKAGKEDLKLSRDAFLNMLEDLTESYNELEELFINLTVTMVSALDAKSHWTKGHSEMVSRYAELISREIGINGDEIKAIKLAGLLHDIGKIGTYDHLLDKPGKLTNEEFEVVKMHPAQGANILQNVKQLKDIIPLVRHHHERIDGSGYPDGLKGDEIPFGARILHVADSYDSMTADRPYRPSPGREYAISELKKYNGKQFDSVAVEAFLNVLDRIEGE